MDLDDQLMMRRLAHKSAVVVCDNFSGTFPAYPDGDTRCRRVSWVDGQMLARLISFGFLELGEAGRYHLTENAKSRFVNPNPDRAHADQHRDLSDQDIYIPEGSVRTAQMNHKVRPLRRLMRLRNKDGSCYLTPAELEAGEQFANDFALGAMGEMATQNYDSVGGGTGRRTGDAQENSMIYRLDARKRASSALCFVGPGLDRALTGVLGQEWSLEQLEQAEHWARHSGRTVLKLALGRLVDFYGTIPGERAKRD